jgi:hypothetical protein
LVPGFVAGLVVGAGGVCGVLGEGGAANAAPLDPGVVHADAAWLLHIDFEAAAGSDLTRQVEAVDPAASEESARAFREMFGIDPDKDLLSLTVYSESPIGAGVAGDALAHDGIGPIPLVLVVDVRAAAADALPAFLSSSGVDALQSQVIEGLAVHSWQVRGKPIAMVVSPGATPERRRVIVGQGAVEVVRAARVVLGERASQASLKQASLDTTPREGSIAYVSMRGDPGAGRTDAQAAMFRGARRMSVDIGERAVGRGQGAGGEGAGGGTEQAPGIDGGSETQPGVEGGAGGGGSESGEALALVYVDVRVRAAEAAHAAEFGTLASGMLSLLRSQVRADPAMKSLDGMLAGVRIERADDLLRLHVEVPSGDIAAMLREPAMAALVNEAMAAAPGFGGERGASGAAGTVPTKATSREPGGESGGAAKGGTP